MPIIETFKKIKTDYVDDNGVVHVDSYKTNDPNEQGFVFGYIINNTIYPDPLAIGAISEMGVYMPGKT